MENFADQCLDMAQSILGHNLESISEQGTISPVAGENSRLDEPGHAALAIGEYYRATNETTLQRGETLVLFTDGITEAFGRGSNNEMFGFGRLDKALTGCSGTPECVVDSIHAALFKFTNERRRDDDQTIVAICAR